MYTTDTFFVIISFMSEKEDLKQKILLIRLSALGDVIFTVPLANILKNSGYDVTWLVSEKGHDIIKNNPAVNKTILAPFAKWKKQGFLKNLREYFEIIKQIRIEKFDVAVDVQGLFKSAIFLGFSGAKRRISYKGAREFAHLAANELLLPFKNIYSKHAVYKYLEFAKYLGINDETVNVTLPETTQKTKEKVDTILKNLDKNKQTIILAPATTWVTKHWQKSNWIELISKLNGKYNLVFTGGKNDIEYINSILPDAGSNIINLAGKTNLNELIEVFKRGDLLVSLDSGSTHLAWAIQKIKIVSIFCSTPKTHYAPLGNDDKYIALSGNLPCEPCHKRKCPLKTCQCTSLPTPDEVLNAIENLLS